MTAPERWNQYLIVGIRLDGTEDFTIAELKEHMDTPFSPIRHKDGVCVLYDEEEHEYIVLGRVVAKSSPNLPFGKNSIGAEDIRVTDEELEETRTTLGRLLDREDVDMDLYIVTHWR